MSDMSEAAVYRELRELGEALGFTGEGLESFVCGREGRPPRGGYDGVVDFGRMLGFDEASAKMFANGRSVYGGLATEQEAREAWGGGVSPPRAWDPTQPIAARSDGSYIVSLELAGGDFAAALEQTGVGWDEARRRARAELQRLATEHVSSGRGAVSRIAAALRVKTKMLTETAPQRVAGSVQPGGSRAVREGGAQ